MLTDATPAPEPSVAVPVTAARALRNWAALGELTVAVGAELSKLNWRLAALVSLVPLGAALSVVVTTIVYDCPSAKVTELVSADQVAKPLPVVAVIEVAPAELAPKVEPLVQKPFASPVFCSLMLTVATPALSLLVPVTAARALRNWAALGEPTVAVGAELSKLNWRLAALVSLVPLGAALSLVVTTIVYDCPSANVIGEVSADQVAKPLPVVAVIAVAPALLALKVEPLVQKPLALPVFCSLMLT